MLRSVMWCGASQAGIAADRDDAGHGRLAVGEVEAVPRLVVGAVDEREAAEGGGAPAVERHPAAGLGADRDRAGPSREPGPDPQRVRALAAGWTDVVGAVGDDDLVDRVVRQVGQQGRDGGDPNRRAAGAGVDVGVGAGVGVGVGVADVSASIASRATSRQRAQPADRQAIYRRAPASRSPPQSAPWYLPSACLAAPQRRGPKRGDGSWGPTGCRSGRDDDAPASSVPRASGSAAAALSCPSGPRFRPDPSGCVRPGPPVTKAQMGAAGLPASPHGPRRCPSNETDHESRDIVEDVSTLASSTERRGL